MKLSDVKTYGEKPEQEKKNIMNWEVMLDVRIIVLLSISVRFVESRSKLCWLLNIYINTI
jgi:hypothetical protein